MEDYIVRATAADGQILAMTASTTNLVRTARQIHSLSPLASAALGRTLTGAAMMSQLLKGEKDTLTLQIKGEGPLGGIVTVADSKANVRGYVYNPDAELLLNSEGKFDIAAGVGKPGYLNVIKDMGMKEPYVGYVELVSGEIAEDIAYYYTCSEQIPSAVSLGVLIDTDGSVAASGGFLLQLMPGASEAMASFLEFRIEELPPVSKFLAAGNSAEDYMELLLEGMKPKISGKAPCRFLCNCSRERMERNLISLGKKELMEIVTEQKGAETQCHFCNSRYNFTDDELRGLIADL